MRNSKVIDLARCSVRSLSGKANSLPLPSLHYRIFLTLECLEARVTPSFIAPINYFINNPADAVAVGDFNNDGIPDLITGNRAPGVRSVSVLLGNGNGTFQTPRDSNAVDGASALAVADFNNDGNLDVVVASEGSTGMVVLLGYGDGTFHLPRAYAAGDQPDFIAVADLNHDGKLDVVVANYQSGTVTVFLGNGDGTFQNGRNFNAGPRPDSLAFGDFTNDGNLDIAVANQNSGPFLPPQVTLLFGNGDGTFQNPVTINAGTDPGGASFVVSGDFNHDGKPDLAVADDNGRVDILLGNGNGTFQTPRVFPTPGSIPTYIATGDLNNDGNTDLAVVGNLGVSILLGNGNGTFQSAVTYAAGIAPNAVGLGDFNQDGNLDFAVANFGSQDVSVRLGLGGGLFPTLPSFPTGSSPESMAYQDLNNDGIPDVVTANVGGNSVSVLLGNSDGTFQAPRTFATGQLTVRVTVADVNGDGIPDLIVPFPGVRGSGNTVGVLLGNGDGTFGNPIVSAAGQGPSFVAAADVNGDGVLDLIVVDGGSFPMFANSDVTVLLGNGDGTFTHSDTYLAGSRPTSLAVGDFNNDKRPDVAVATASGVYLLLGNPDGTFRQTVVTASRDGTVALVGDFNDDGNLDLVIAGGSVLTARLGNGDGTFQPPQTFFCGGGNAFTATVADFDLDGHLDIAVATGGGVNVLLGNGDGTFQFDVNSYGVGTDPLAIAAGGLNGDSYPDVITANAQSNDVTILYNAADWGGGAPRRGPGSFSSRQPGAFSKSSTLATDVVSPPVPHYSIPTNSDFPVPVGKQDHPNPVRHGQTLEAVFVGIHEVRSSGKENPKFSSSRKVEPWVDPFLVDLI